MINVNDCHGCSNRDRVEGQRRNHSELAMKAAKRMRRSSHKEKTGHTVCQHLLEMLADNQVDLDRRTRRYQGRSINFNQNSRIDSGKSDAAQISLSF